MGKAPQVSNFSTCFFHWPFSSCYFFFLFSYQLCLKKGLSKRLRDYHKMTKARNNHIVQMLACFLSPRSHCVKFTSKTVVYATWQSLLVLNVSHQALWCGIGGEVEHVSWALNELIRVKIPFQFNINFSYNRRVSSSESLRTCSQANFREELLDTHVR